MPKVSVIIPNYNHARYLRQRVESVLAQTYQDFEVILLDDASTDESRSIVLEYAGDPRVRVEFNEKNSGSGFKQWNKGVRLARGRYVWIAESDDYAEPVLLERLVAQLESNPGAVICKCRSWRVSSSGDNLGLLDSYLAHVHGERWAVDFLADGVEECRTCFVRCNPIPNASAVVFTRDVYERVGGVDESLLYCGDWKLWAAIALTGGPIAYVGQPLSYYRVHEANATAKSQRLGMDAVEYLQVVRWILERVTPTEGTRKKMCEDLFHVWHPRVLTNRIPVRRRWAIFKDARAIDRHALRKLCYPALVALRMTLSRRYRLLRSRI